MAAGYFGSGCLCFFSPGNFWCRRLCVFPVVACVCDCCVRLSFVGHVGSHDTRLWYETPAWPCCSVFLLGLTKHWNMCRFVSFNVGFYHELQNDSIGRLFSFIRSIYCLLVHLIVWLIVLLIDWFLIIFLIGSSIDWLIWLLACLVHQSIDWLIGWRNDGLILAHFSSSSGQFVSGLWCSSYHLGSRPCMRREKSTKRRRDGDGQRPVVARAWSDRKLRTSERAELSGTAKKVQMAV